MKNRLWKDLLRSWSQHTGMQFATLTVLAATFTVLSTVLLASLNLQRILDRWGESVNMTVYLQESAKPEQVSQLKRKIEELKVFSSMEFVSKEKAKSSFEEDLAHMLPSIAKDKSFGNPFPASFELGLKDKILKIRDTSVLDGIAQTITEMVGVEDVTYGQDWVKNYAALLSGVNRFGLILVAIMLFGGVLVIGNGLRSAIAQRRDEIEILELVGATYSMIRRPYVVDGALTGFLAGAFALIFTATIYHLGVDTLASQINFLSIRSQVQFLDVRWMVAILATSTGFGFLGSYIFVREINRGYAAIGKVRR